MKKPHYDYVFVTHLPAFYKVNLYNTLAQHCRVFVIFVASTSTIRSPDFTPGDFHFDYRLLNKNEFEKRNLFLSALSIYHCLRKISFEKIVVGGWDLIEFWWLILLNPKRKNCLALESSLYECSVKGLTGWLKRVFMSRIHLAFASGEPHADLLASLGFKGKIAKTLGVGIFNYQALNTTDKTFSGKFLYVGRLAAEKNLSLLFQAFAELPQFNLSVIGQGPLEACLKQQCPKNISLLGHVPNQALAQHYQSHDAFILPSVREPWGLVIEEALYYGLPVIASNRVGCARDLIVTPKLGLLFDPLEKSSLVTAILRLSQQYQRFCEKVKQVDFKARDSYQVRQYLEALP